MLDFGIFTSFQKQKRHFPFDVFRKIVGAAAFDSFFNVTVDKTAGNFGRGILESILDQSDEFEEKVALFVEHELFDSD